MSLPYLAISEPKSPLTPSHPPHPPSLLATSSVLPSRCSPLCITPSLSVDCNKTLALQFMFAPLARSPAKPQLLPVVHGSGSLPPAKRYLQLKLHTLCFPSRPTYIVLLSYAPPRGSGEGGLNGKARHPWRLALIGFLCGGRLAAEHVLVRACTLSYQHECGTMDDWVGSMIMRTLNSKYLTFDPLQRLLKFSAKGPKGSTKQSANQSRFARR